MKKIQYIAPSIKVANVQLQSLLVDSLGRYEEGGIPSNMQSKAGSFEYDEEEDF